VSDLYGLTDEQMDCLESFFPKNHGKPRVDDHRVLSGIILVNRNGLRGRDVLSPGIRSTQDALQPLECYGDIHPHDAEELV
jgi:transposase